jgi:signal transduction histidine kinase/DNA-binding NarL/FixJ family response regulator
MEVPSPRRYRRGPRTHSSPSRSVGLEDHVYRALLDSLDVGVAHVSAEGKLLYGNPSFLGLVGAKAGLEPEKNLRAFIAVASWGAFESALKRAVQVPVEGKMTIEGVGVPARVLQLSFTPLRSGDTNSVGIVALEVTELLRIRKDLEASEESLQLLSGRILRLQDEERRRIARDLHDVIGQEVAVVSVTLDCLNKQLGESGPNVRQMIDESVRLLTRIQEEIRTLSYLLHPPMLDELGIASAVGQYVEGFEKRSGIQVAFDTPAEFPRLSGDKEIALFRLVQEALTNVLRHSGSKSAQVTLSAEGDHVKAAVRDKGVGMALDVLSSITKKNVQLGVGIPGLRERLKQLGGRLQIRTKLPGTEISAVLPLSVQERTSSSGETIEPSVGSASAESEPLPFPNGARKRVLIADDHEVTRQGLRTLLASQPDLEICAEVADGLDAVVQTEEMKPDLVILDSAMPRAGGIYAAHMIREAGLNCKILIFAEHRYPQLEPTLKAIQCDGYVLKSNLASDLLQAVRFVLAGHNFFSGGSRSPLFDGGGVEQGGVDKENAGPMGRKPRARAKGTS